LGALAADMISHGIAGIEMVEVVPFTETLQSTNMRRFQSLDQIKALAHETDAGTVISGNYYMKKLVSEDPLNMDYLGYLGILASRLNNREEALKVVEIWIALIYSGSTPTIELVLYLFWEIRIRHSHFCARHFWKESPVTIMFTRN
jgi:hypothetical protein